MWIGRSKIVCSAALVALGVTFAAGMQDQIPKEPIKWSVKAKLPDKPLKAGDPFSLQLTATIEPGWHLYSTDQSEGGPTPTRIVLPAEQPFKQAGPVQSSEPKSALDPNFNLIVEYYEDEAEFVVPVDVSSTAAPGTTEAKVNVSFQTCNDQLCLPPRTVRLAVGIEVSK